MNVDHEEFRAMTTLRMARKVSSDAICFYVKPSSRRSKTMVESKGSTGFDYDQALIELFGILGAV